MGHGRTADRIDRPFHYHDMPEDTVELMRWLEIETAANDRFDGYTTETQEYALTFSGVRPHIRSRKPACLRRLPASVS
jgi:hypothetical protein